MVLPLVVVPLLLVGAVVGTSASRKAYAGVTKASADDLEHMAAFAIDLMAAHHQQFTTYKAERGHTSVSDGAREEAFERRALEELKARLKAKKVGRTGYIYALDSKGIAVIHPFREGEDLSGATDDEGRHFIAEIVEKKTGWIRYPWRNEGEASPRMKIVRFEYFAPYDWIVAVGSYENEFLHDAEALQNSIARLILFATLGCALASVILLFYASRAFTDPVVRMTRVIRSIKSGRSAERMEVASGDELGDLARAFNRMSDKLQKHREIEASLATQGKMASLGVLSSGVAHEINNPLAVILGFAAYLEKKLPPDDPNLKYVQEIHRESKRCTKIVQDLLAYARAPKPEPRPQSLNALLGSTVEFASNHTRMSGVAIVTDFAENLPLIPFDGDQMRQIAMNVLLNAAQAMDNKGRLIVATRLAGNHEVEITFTDDGCGIPPENISKVFEPFFTTGARSTGLGLAITRQLVEAAHGGISIESQVGAGTKVTITLPLDHQEF